MGFNSISVFYFFSIIKETISNMNLYQASSMLERFVLLDIEGCK